MLRLPHRSQNQHAPKAVCACFTAAQRGAATGSEAAAGLKQNRQQCHITPLSTALQSPSSRGTDPATLLSGKPCSCQAAPAAGCPRPTSNTLAPATAGAAAAQSCEHCPGRSYEICLVQVGPPSSPRQLHAAALAAPAATTQRDLWQRPHPSGRRARGAAQPQPFNSSSSDSSSSYRPMQSCPAATEGLAIPKTPFFVGSAFPLAPAPGEKESGAVHPTHHTIRGSNGRPKHQITKHNSIQLCRQQELIPADIYSTPRHQQHQEQHTSADAHCGPLGSSYQLPGTLDATLSHINRSWLELQARNVNVVAALGMSVADSKRKLDPVNAAISAAALGLLQSTASAAWLRNRRRTALLMQRGAASVGVSALLPAKPLHKLVHLRTPLQRSQSAAATVSAAAATAAKKAAAVNAAPVAVQQAHVKAAPVAVQQALANAAAAAAAEYDRLLLEAEDAMSFALAEDTFCASQPDSPSSCAAWRTLSSSSDSSSSSTPRELDRPSYVSSTRGGCSSGGGCAPAAAHGSAAPQGKGCVAAAPPAPAAAHEGVTWQTSKPGLALLRGYPDLSEETEPASRWESNPMLLRPQDWSPHVYHRRSSSSSGSAGAKPGSIKAWWRKVRALKLQLLAKRKIPLV